MGQPARSSARGRSWLWRCAAPLLIFVGISALLLTLSSLVDLNDEGETPTLPLENQTSAFVNQTLRKGIGDRGRQWTEVLSWFPRAFVYHNFLSEEECEHLIELAKPHMQKSLVFDSNTGQRTDSRYRTSSSMSLRRGHDEIIEAIEKRIADFTFIPVENGEGLQIIHYEVGQRYDAHFDYYQDPIHRKGNQRTATVVIYLSDVEEGGETVFPRALEDGTYLPWYNELSECGKKGLALKPKKGDALLFWSTKPDATLDVLSLHGGCPVIKGNKWSCTKWLHLSAFIGLEKESSFIQ